MSEAYQCDLCRILGGSTTGPYHDGSPHKSLYVHDGHDRAQNRTYSKVLDLCEKHTDMLELQDQDQDQEGQP